MDPLTPLGKASLYLKTTFGLGNVFTAAFGWLFIITYGQSGFSHDEMTRVDGVYYFGLALLATVDLMILLTFGLFVLKALDLQIPLLYVTAFYGTGSTLILISSIVYYWVFGKDMQLLTEIVIYFLLGSFYAYAAVLGALELYYEGKRDVVVVEEKGPAQQVSPVGVEEHA